MENFILLLFGEGWIHEDLVLGEMEGEPIYTSEIISFLRMYICIIGLRSIGPTEQNFKDKI